MTDAPESHIDYEKIVHETLRGVIPRTLSPFETANSLPGAHHFYIAFQTTHPEVQMPSHLRAQYPKTMTIVLQHQFEDLRVGDDGFSVTLGFGGSPSHLYVPYLAIEAFQDPSVGFGLRFDPTGSSSNDVQEVAEKADEESQPAQEAEVVHVDFRSKKNS